MKRWPGAKITLRNRARERGRTSRSRPLKGGGIIIRSASCGTIWARRSTMAAARTTANANCDDVNAVRWVGHRLGLSTSSSGGRRAWPRLRRPFLGRPLCPLRFTPSTAATGAVRFAVVAQAVLAEACSRKEFFDELADNLEARSDRYTHQSGPGIIALF